MASGHVNRTSRPNTWLLRPALRREDFPCQPGAVHTWHILSVNGRPDPGQLPEVVRTRFGQLEPFDRRPISVIL